MSKKDERIEPNQRIIGSAYYKGKKYLVLWRGTTKTGKQRTLLGAYNGEFKFFADSALVSSYSPYKRPISFSALQRLMNSKDEHDGPSVCDECGRRTSNLREARDSSGIPGMVCSQCAQMSPYERSFA